jgi:hypothetical protein
MIRVALSLLLALVTPLATANGADSQETPPAPKPERAAAQIYKLETVELQGSSRMTSDQLATELGLVPGTPLDDELVMNTRSKLLGLGLFKSAILLMRRGTQPGLAKLVVEVEDDPGVLSDWALGGELGVTVAETTAPSSVDASAAPMDYRLGLVGRNLFTDLHRGSLYLDIDSEGEVRQGQLAYGLPRFAKEGAQFDAEIAVVDPYYRYLDAMGFGARGQGLWSRTVVDVGELQYGAAMYINKKPKFAVPGFPSSVAGPKVAYYKETRLRGFFPGAGHLIAASLLLAPTDTENSVLELNLAKTWDLAKLLFLTVDGRMLSVATEGYSVRAEGRLDVPFGSVTPGEDQAAGFVRLRGGHDSVGKTSLVGSMAMIGVRYHSSGFIAEFGVKITRSPEELAPKTIGNAPDAGDARGIGAAP